MKYAIALIAGLAILASVHAAPAAEDDVYISDALKELVKALREKGAEKLQELKEKRDELREKIRSATGTAKEQLKEALENVTNEIRSNTKGLLDAIKKALKKDDESYFKDALVARIRDYSQKAQEILRSVSAIVKKEAAALTERAKAQFEEQKQNLIDQVQRINEQIKQAVTDAINGKQESYSFDSETYFIAGLRQKVAELTQQAKDLAAKAAVAFGEKKRELLEHLEEVKKELVLGAKDVRDALREMVGKEPLAYGLAEDLDEVYFLQTVKDLRRKLNEKLEEFKGYVEMIKAAHGAVKQSVKDGFATLKEEIKSLKEGIIEKVKEELNKPHTE